MTQETSPRPREAIRLINGKLLYVPEGMTLEDPDDYNYMMAYLGKYFPEDAKARGIKLNSADNPLTQLGNELGVSGGSMVSGLEGALDWITGNKSQDDWGGQKFSQDLKSNYSLETLSDVADDGLSVGDVWRGVTESAAPIAIGAATGGFGGLAAKGLGASAAIQTGVGIGAAAGAEAAIGAGSSFNNVFQGIMNQKDDPSGQVQNSEEYARAYQAALAKTGDAKAARDMAWEDVAYGQASLAAPGAAVANAIPSLIGGTVLQKAISPIVSKAARGPLKFVSDSPIGKQAQEFASKSTVRPFAAPIGQGLKVAGAEGVEEALQSGGETLAQNVAMGQVDPRVSPFEGVGEAAVLGGLSGALGGGLVGGGLSAYANMQTNKDNAFSTGVVEREQIGEARRQAEQKYAAETFGAAANAANAERTRAATELAAKDKEAAKQEEYPGIQGTRYKPNAAPQDPTAVPRIGLDPTVSKPETFVYEPPFSEEVARARGEVRSVIKNGERATIEKPVKQGKKTVVQKVSAAEEFDSIFTPDEKVSAAHKKVQAAESQYEYDRKSYNSLPENQKPGFKRHMADSRAQLNKAIKEYNGQRKAAEARLRTKANQWNDIARANGLPEVKFGKRQETVGGKATGPSGSLVKSQQSSAPAQPKPTADDYMTQAAELEDRLTRVSGRSFDMSLPEAERAAAKTESDSIRAQLDEVNAAIEESYGAAGSFDPSSILDESGAVNKNALRGEQQRAEQRAVLDFSDPAQRSVVEQEFEQDAQPVEQQQEATPSAAEATRLLDASQLPVERTDVKTPRLDQQGRENKLSDEYTYEVAPVSDKGTIDRFNENAATQDGSYTGAPTTGFKIVKTTKGLHGTNIGKPGRRTFATREEAEDFLANDPKIKDKVNIPKTAWDRKAAKDQERAELDRERADEREAYLNLRAKAAFDRTYKELHDKLMAIAEEELRRVGLLQKGVKLASFDTQRKDAAGGDIGNQVYSMIREYNQNAMILGGAPMSNKAGTDLAKFDKGTQGAFIQWGNKANPLSIIALNRNLISPNMTPQQMKEAVNRVVHHELVHALVRGGFVTPQEYSALLRLARKRKMPGELGVDGGKITYLDYTKLAYRDQTEQVQEEEAIAELIALEGFGVSKTPMGGEVRGVIDRVVRVIKALFGMLGDKDFRTFVDFMEGVKDGSVARRTLSSIGFDPTNTLDPFGRNLGAARADMRVGLPMQAPTNMIIEMRNKIINHAKANKGVMPKGLSIGQIYGVPFIDMNLKFKPDFSTEYFIARIPGAKSVQTRDRKVSRPDGSFDTVRDGYVTTATPENAVKLSDIIDLSEIQKYAPDIAKRLSEVGVISEMKPGKSIASVYHNKPEELSQKIFLNGQRTDVISLNARFIFGMRDMKEAQKFLAHEVQHLIDIYAGRGSFPVLSSMGSTAGEFSLDSRSPRMTPEQKARGATEAEFPSSEISRTLSYGNNLISSVVNAETLRVVEDMKRGLGDTMTGEMMEGYLRLQEAAQEFNHIFWEGLAPQAASAGPQLAKLQNMGSPDQAMTTLHDEIGKLQSMSIDNERKANAAIGEVLSELMQSNPQASGFYSFVAQNLLTSQIFSTLMNVEQNLLNDVNSNTPFETMLGRQALYVVADDIARLLELNNSYRGEEGEAKALAAESSDSSAAGVMERIRPVSNIANVNNPPSRWTEDQVNMAFPKLPVNDEVMQGMYENTGSKVFADSRINPTAQETSSKFMENITNYAKGQRADMRSGDMSALNGLNIQDVEVLMNVFKESPSINIEEATKLLNARKKSERRPYRPNEVQGIVNRIAAINPDYARDGTNPEALIKYEKLWGTDRLKGVLAEATLGTPDASIAKKFGLARASLRNALNEINVQPATPVAGITPELAARRVPEDLVKRAFYRLTKDSDQSLALTPESAFNSNGHWNPARGPDFVRQEMLRSSEDGMEGRTLGQILDTLRKSGYKGGNTPVVNAFIKYETSIKKRLDPEYYIGGNRANMTSGPTDEDGKIVDLGMHRTHRKLSQEIKDRVNEKVKTVNKMFAAGSTNATDIGNKMLAELRREDPILWKRLTDSAAKRAEERGYENELNKNLANHFLNKPLQDQARTMKQLNTSINNYKKFSDQEETRDGKQSMLDISAFLQWATNKYVAPYYSAIGGNRADMTSGPTDDDGKVVSLNQRITDRDIARLEAERVKMGDKQREQMGELLGVPTTDIDIIQRKVFADLKKDVPFLWKKLNDGGEELVKTMSRQVKNIALAGPEGFRERAMRRVENYKNLIDGEQDNRAGSAKLQNMIQFFEWVANKYSPNEPVGGNRADMRAGRNQIATPGRERKWIASKVDSKEWNDARRMLSKDEFDVYSTINDMANENGMLTREVLDEINQDREEEKFIDVNTVSHLVNRMRQKGYTIAHAQEQKDRVNEIIRRKDEGERSVDIAADLYANEIADRPSHMDYEQARLRASNTVNSIYSQERKRRRNAELAGQRADLKITKAGELAREALKKNRTGVQKNLAEYVLKVEGDAVLDQMTALHKLFGRFVTDPEKLIFEQINTAEGLERILQKYRQAGGKIDADSNPVFQEDESRGKTRPEIERVIDEAFKPILEAIGTLNVEQSVVDELSKQVDTAARWFEAQKENGREDLSYNSVGLYLLAKHAPYREAFIKSKRKQSAELMGGEGSLGVGIQLEDAGKIVKFFDEKFGQDVMAKFSELAANATKKLTSIREEGGLIPTGLTSIPFYVPARGFAERDGEEELHSATVNPGSRGRTPVRQDPSTRGRLSLPDDPLTSLAQMMQVAVMRKNVNETLNSLRRLVENNAGLFEGKGKFVAAVHYEKPKGLDLNNEPLWLRGRVIKGENDQSVGDSSDLFYIELSPEFSNIAKHFMPSMFNKGKIENLLQSTRVIEPAMNFLRAVRTSKNPAFLPVNLVRDIGTGVFNIEMYIPNSQGEFLKRTPAVLMQVMKDIMAGGKPTTKYGALAQEFIDNGGNQNLYVIDDYDRLAKQIADKLQKINHGETSVTEKAKNSIVALGDFLEKANNAAELVSRVAAYSIAKERYMSEGMSEREAIKRGVYIGRNLTVNFNKHGSLGKGMNNLYMFWNASVGGTAQILRAASSNPKVRAQLMTIVGVGFALPFIMRAMMGDEWEKIPDWVKDRNFIVPVGGGNFFTVPLPYGYSWFLTAGMNASESAYKAQDPLYGPGGAAQWLALRSVDGLMNNFSPTGTSSDVLTLVAPTLADPVLELAMNKDWTGRPIMPEPGMRDYDRQSQLFWSNTAPIYTGISDALSGMTGGHNRIDGLIEVSPNALEYVSEFVFGGLGKFINQNVSLATGKAEDVSDIPIVRSFIGSTGGEVSVSSDYSSLQNKVKRVERSIADAQAAGNYNMIQNLERQYAYETSLIPVFKSAERKIDRLQSARRAIENKYRESSAQPNEGDRNRLDEIREQIRGIKRQAIDEVAKR